MVSTANTSNLLWLHETYANCKVSDVVNGIQQSKDIKHEIAVINNDIAKLNSYPGMKEEQKAILIDKYQARVGKLQTQLQQTDKYTLSIGKLAKDSDSKTKAFLKLELMKLNANLSLNKPMRETDIILVVDALIDQYRSLTLADIAIVMDRIILGEYGEFFERISASKIMQCFKKYWEERLEVYENLSLKKHHEDTSRIPDTSHLDNEAFYRALEIGNIENAKKAAKQAELEANKRLAARDYAKMLFEPK